MHDPEDPSVAIGLGPVKVARVVAVRDRDHDPLCEFGKRLLNAFGGFRCVHHHGVRCQEVSAHLPEVEGSVQPGWIEPHLVERPGIL